MFNKGGFAAGAENALAAIFSLSGYRLTAAEKSFFRESNPFGFILFARNIENPKQIKELTAGLQDLLGRRCPVLIDQEGGRVQRLKPPLWRQYPAMREFGEGAQTDIESALENLRFAVLQLAEEIAAEGFNVNCAPVLDVLTQKTHEVIGDRAFSSDPDIVARLGLSVCRSLLAAGITPVIKHIPGHGRAAADSHLELPVVDESRKELKETDFRPFADLARSDVSPAVWGMTAHVVFSDIDAALPITISEDGIRKIIRKSIGFDGFLISDGVEMKALDKYGDIGQRCRLALEAGCDAALYCDGKLEDMVSIADSAHKLSPEALKRLQNAGEFPKLTV